MYLIALGALIVAAGVALLSLPAGLVVLGLEVIAAGAYQDLSTPDDVETEER